MSHNLLKSLRLSIFLLQLTVAFTTCRAAAATTSGDSPPWPVTLRSQIAQLTDVSFRIGRNAARQCPATFAGTGLSLDYIQAYDKADRTAVAELLGMTDRPQVAAVAADSPARLADVRPGDAIVTIDGTDVIDLLATSAEPSLFADTLEQRLAETPEGVPVKLELLRDGIMIDANIAPVRVCAVRVVIKTDKTIEGYTDGHNIAISSGLIKFSQNASELALFVGHEMAHVIHRDGKARNLKERRQMEDRADITGANLMSCAGYDLEAGLGFWTRFSARDWLGWARAPTHRSPTKRVALMRQATSTFTCSNSSPSTEVNNPPVR